MLHRCTVIYGLSLGCIVYRKQALFHQYEHMNVDLYISELLLTGYQARFEDGFILDHPLGHDDDQI